MVNDIVMCMLLFCGKGGNWVIEFFLLLGGVIGVVFFLVIFVFFWVFNFLVFFILFRILFFGKMCGLFLLGFLYILFRL